MSRNQHDVVRDHFGVLADAQIASGTPSSGDVPVSDGAGGRAWGAGGGGGSDFDKVGTAYRFPAGGGYDRIEQEDLGDSTDAYLQLTAGNSIHHGTDGTGQFDVNAQG